MDLSIFLDRLLKEFPHQPTAGQVELAKLLGNFLADPDRQSIFVLKGYAGTGKTSFISALVRALPGFGLKSVLLAPTGRAAKVFASYSGKTAYTIHKRIYFRRIARDGSTYMILQNNLYRNTLFIVDEASMIAGESREADNVFQSLNVLDDMLNYAMQGANCKLMLIGDTAQLPPVGTNLSPALDLEFLKSRYNLKLYHYELTEVVRQSIESGILHNATRIRNMLTSNHSELPLLDLKDKTDITSINGMDLEDRLNTAFSKKNQGKSVVVCRSNKIANIYNREIRNRILFRENEISSGDFLMVVKNNYFWLDPEASPGFIANGDIVEVMRIQRTEEEYGFHFADVTVRMIDYPDEPTLDVKILLDTLMSEGPALTHTDQQKFFQAVMEEYHDIPERTLRYRQVRINSFFNALQVKFAYALTCHKTQGGQWNNVFIDQGFLKDEQIDSEFLRWLYTAITRATDQVFLINFREKLINS
jgi:ATP-dependent exoDNAse (exonuclease V) alpha subunit